MSENEYKIVRKLIKKDFNKLAITILMKELLANIAVFIFMFTTMVFEMLRNSGGEGLDLEKVLNDNTYIGVASIIAAIISVIPFLIFRGKKFIQYDLKVKNKRITIRTIVINSVILLSLNSALVLFSNLLELILNTIGLSASSSLEALDTLNSLTLPMIIYSCLLGPVVEEMIYRGAVLRSLERYGKKFAIIISGILFGLMHGNFFQIFMGMGVGILLGYLASEYSIKLTIILHIINNTSVEVLSQISFNISENLNNLINLSLLIVSVIILIITLIYNKNYLKKWMKENKTEKGTFMMFFTSILVILVVVIDLFEVFMNIQKIT